MRTLLAFCDTEGCPQRGAGTSSLWDFCAIFKYVVDEDFNVIEYCFHVYQLSLPRYLTRELVGTRLKAHFAFIDFLKKELTCDSICFCFWNAPHDLSVLSHYDISNLTSIDLLAAARKLTENKHESYKIGKLCAHFNIRLPDSAMHTGLGDVLRMVELLPYVGVTKTSVLLSFAKARSPRASPCASPRASPHESPHAGPPASPHAGPRASPLNYVDVASLSIEFARNLRITKR
jgi:hypothetical protein